MWHSATSAAGQSERSSTVCGKIPTSGPLGTRCLAACSKIPTSTPQKCPFLCGIWAPIYHVVPLAHPSPQPKRHLDWFSRFCMAHGRYRRTDDAAQSVAIAASRLVGLLRCGLIILMHTAMDAASGKRGWVVSDKLTHVRLRLP